MRSGGSDPSFEFKTEQCPTESITSEIPQGCELIPGWEDGAGDGCGWVRL